jgi:hypothetical protein
MNPARMYPRLKPKIQTREMKALSCRQEKRKLHFIANRKLQASDEPFIHYSSLGHALQHRNRIVPCDGGDGLDFAGLTSIKRQK